MTLGNIKKLCGASVLSVAALAFADNHTATVEMKNAQGLNVGEVKLTQTGAGLEVDLNLHGLPPGTKAIHVHENAKCDAPKFESAGSHYSPENREHGFNNVKGPHAGDLPNFTVDAGGNAKTQLKVAKLTHPVLGQGNRAIVIHAKADDMKSNPAGNSGERIACGVLQQ